MSHYASAFAALLRPAKTTAKPGTPSSDWKPEVALVIASDPTKCILPDGRTEHVKTANLAGFFVLSPERQAEIRTIAEAKTNDTTLSVADRAFAKQDLEKLKVEQYAHAIRSLPEARSRPGAAARILRAHTERSLPPARAAVFLANLPQEVGEPVASSHTAPQPAAIPLKRKAELALSHAATKANAGDAAAKRRVAGIGAALRLNAERGFDLARALEVNLINPASL